MARPTTLLAVIACAVAIHPPSYPDYYDSDSDSYSLWDDYESIETTSAKVIIRGKRPTVNFTRKTQKKDDNKFIKTTNISIQSHTNYIVTEAPLAKPFSGTRHPVVQIGDQYLLVQAPDMSQASTNKPKPLRRPQPISTRRPSTMQRPLTTTRRPSTTRRFKTTKAPKSKKKTCPPKKTGWFSSFFQQKKSPKKPDNKSGIFTSIYNWIAGSKTSWFGTGSWFQESPKPKKPNPTQSTLSMSTTLTTTPGSWFHNLIESEENDANYITNDLDATKKSMKKPLKKSYAGYQLIRIFLDAQWKVDEILQFQDDAQGSGLMWWTPPSMNGSTDILVPPDLLTDVKDHLKSLNIDYDVVIWDLQKAITYENPRLSKKQRLELEQTRGHPMTWRRYHRYADILRYLEYLQHSHSDLVELVPLGRSSEGLPLVAVKISLPSNDSFTRNSNGKEYNKKWKLRSRMKPAVWVDGGTHAREWIAPAVATWMLHSLVEGESRSVPDMEMLEQADLYIMPVLNPDGYEHSHTHDRLWRKTRSRAPDHDEDYYTGWFPWNWGKTECLGVDADRNWDYRWGEQDSSRDPCMDNYAGPHPFSEPETRAVSEFLAEHRGRIKVFITLHAYSQSWLVPSSHAHSSFADDGLLLEMGKLATAALADSYGTKYRDFVTLPLSHLLLNEDVVQGSKHAKPAKENSSLRGQLPEQKLAPDGRLFIMKMVGTISELRQAASGMSHDWAKSRAGIKFSYHIDLRDSLGPYGFLLPGSQIVSTARETWQAIKVIVDNISPG